MLEILMNLFVNVALMIIAILSVKKDIVNKPQQKAHWKNLKPTGKLLIVLSALVVFFNLYKDINSYADKKEVDNNSKNRDALHEKREDSLANDYKEKVKQASKEIIQNYTYALSKWGLHYDSMSSVIQKTVKDSLRYNLFPRIEICSSDGIVIDSTIGNKLHFTTYLCALNSNIHDADLAFYVAGVRENRYVYIGKVVAEIQKDTYIIPDHQAIGTRFQLLSDKPFSMLFLLLKGNFKDDNGKTHKTRSTFSFQIPKRILSTPGVLIAKSVDSLFKSHNL